jgi:TolB-like protein
LLIAPMPDQLAIFLSYASEDAEAARRISEALKSAGLVVWFDQSELRGGDAWDQRIRRQIKDCSLFVPIISAHTQARPEGYFRLEWHLAEQRSFLMVHSKAFIVPVVVDDTPDAEALVPDRFRERHWTRFPDGRVPQDFATRFSQLLGGTAPVARPVAAEFRPSPASAAVSERSVAIMPFANLSDDKENEYFSEGVSDELLTVLQTIPGLRVAARTSAFSFKGKHASIRDIGSQLSVAYLVEGGVQKSGNRVKVAARLTNVATGELKWSRSYTREIKDVFALQEELAVAIVGELRGRLVGDEASLVQQANRGGTRNPEAYQEYLLGKHLYDQSSEESVSRAIPHFRAATELDPQFALAWVRLAEVQIWRCGYVGSLTTEQFDTALADGRKAVGQALELEPDLGAGLATRAWVQFYYDFDLKGAAATMQRANEVAPNELDVLVMSARLLDVTDNGADSLKFCQRLVAMDPINSRRHLDLAFALAGCGRFDEARVAAARYMELNPGAILARTALSFIYILEGRYAEADKAIAPGAEDWPELWLRAIINHGLGRAGESDAVLDRMVGLYADGAAVQIAPIHAARGESDLAFQWMERSRQQRDAGLLAMYRSPLFRPLRSDPRWRPFWTRLGVVSGS